MKGTYILKSSKKVAVAVKTLKEEDIPGQKVFTKFLLQFIMNKFILWVFCFNLAS